MNSMNGRRGRRKAVTIGHSIPMSNNDLVLMGTSLFLANGSVPTYP